MRLKLIESQLVTFLNPDSSALPVNEEQEFEGGNVRAIPETMVRLPVPTSLLEESTLAEET